MEIILQNRRVEFSLRVSSRVRGLYLKVSLKEGLEVVVPRSYDLRRIPRVLQQKERWILKHLEKFSRERHHRPLFGEGMKISVLGREKIVRIDTEKRDRLTITETDREIFLAGADFPKAALERYLKRTARDFFAERVGEFAQAMDARYGRISIRAQQSRWGSCNRQGDLSFNWRLVLMPPDVIDYVIIHELAHTFHHDHSKRFYAVVEKFCPEYKRRRKVLREMQDLLPL